VKVAVTLVFAVRVKVQVAVPLQAPDQPAKVEPEAGEAVRVTGVPLVKLALHVVPQLMPAGVLVTVPPPVPARATLSVGAAAAVLKVAVTAVLAVRAREQVEVPEQAPDQPAKVEPVPGVAVRVTLVPLEKEALQVEPQLMPLGLLVTVPVPVPARETLSIGAAEAALKLAVAEESAFRVSVQVAVPEQPPDQPTKVEPAAGVAVRVMVVPPLKLALQVAPQLIPEGTLVTVPEPVPLACTVSWKVEPGEEELMLPPPQPVARTAAAKQPQTERIRRMGTKPASINASLHLESGASMIDEGRVVVLKRGKARGARGCI
jgi:hypothetical protein